MNPQVGGKGKRGALQQHETRAPSDLQQPGKLFLPSTPPTVPRWAVCGVQHQDRKKIVAEREAAEQAAAADIQNHRAT